MLATGEMFTGTSDSQFALIRASFSGVLFLLGMLACYPNSMNASERYLTDEDGRRVAVVLTLDAYQTLLEELEELESLRAFDRAKASDDEIIPLEDAVAEIERQR